MVMAMSFGSHFQGKPLLQAVCEDVTMKVSEGIRLLLISQFSATEMNEVALRKNKNITEFTDSGFW